MADSPIPGKQTVNSKRSIQAVDCTIETFSRSERRLLSAVCLFFFFHSSYCSSSITFPEYHSRISVSNSSTISLSPVLPCPPLLFSFFTLRLDPFIRRSPSLWSYLLLYDTSGILSFTFNTYIMSSSLRPCLRLASLPKTRPRLAPQILRSRGLSRTTPNLRTQIKSLQTRSGLPKPELRLALCLLEQ